MALTKITANIIEDGAISTASLADTSITADKLAATLDLTGKTITVATATAGDNDTTVASTAFVSTAIANLADSAPETLDTLNELAAALGDDANFSTTVTNSIAAKLPLAGGTVTGNTTFNTLVGVNKAINSSVGLSIGADATATNSYGLEVCNSTSNTRFLVDGVGSSFFYKSDNAIGMKFDASTGNVGIGTSSPASKLHIFDGGSSVNNTITFGNPSATPKAEIKHTAGGNEFLNISCKGTTSGFGNISFYTGATPDERMVIDSSGNVGIGTDSPNAPLEVNGGTTMTGGWGRSLLLRHPFPMMVFQGEYSTDTYAGIGYDNTSGMAFMVNSPTIDLFANSQSAAMVIDNSKNVGIGTSSPAYKLDVNGNIGVGTTSTGQSIIQMLANPTNGATTIHFGDGSGSSAYAGYINYAHGDNSLQFGNSSAEKMRLDNSGNLLVGNTSSGGSGKCQASVGFDAQDGSNTTSIAIRNYSSAANSGSILVDPDNVGASSVMYFGIDGVAPSKMRLDSAGRLNIDQVDTRFGTGALNITGEVGANYNAIQFRHNASTIVGTVVTTASSTAYNTSSDYRLKENVDYTWDATTRLKQLKPARFNFIDDETNTLIDGFLAHEVSSIVPEAITGEKDGVKEEEYEITPAVLNDDGTVVTEAVMGTREAPDYQGIDQSKLVPLLTKAIQEQQTIIEDLQARIETLENP